MKEIERAALTELAKTNWAPTRESVWTEPAAHVDGLNDRALRTVMTGFADAKASDAESPIGVVVTGRPGSGKTHLVATVRKRISAAGGYFFALELRHERSFWQKVVLDVLGGLLQLGSDGLEQGVILRRELSRKLNLPEPLHRQLVGLDKPTRSGLDDMVEALDQVDRRLAFECGHTLRALALLASDSVTIREVGIAYLSSESESVVGERAEWGLRVEPRTSHEMVGELFKLIALTGPSVIALDQIDTLIKQSERGTDSVISEAASYNVSDSIGLPRRRLFEDVGSGLMELREATRRSLVLVACMDLVWQGIRDYAPGSVEQRFRRAEQLDTIPTAAVGQALIERRFALKFKKVGFVPPYPSWPVRWEAFADAVRFTARGLIRQVDTHIQVCLDANEVTELSSFSESSRVDAAAPRPGPAMVPVDHGALIEIDRQLAALVNDAGVIAEIAKAFDPYQEDQRIPDLLCRALDRWVAEQGEECIQYEVPTETMAAGNPALHAELQRIVDEGTEDKIYWSFRAIAWTDARAVINRIDRVLNTTGLDPAAPKRKVYLLRTGDWSNGGKTRQKVQEFEAAGGVVVRLPRETLEIGLRTFAALERLAATQPPAEFNAWLLSRRPASHTALLRAVFGDPPDDVEPPHPEPEPTPGPQLSDMSWPMADPDTTNLLSVAAPVTVDPVTLHVGDRMDTGTAVTIALESLRKHTAIFAGSGSGKTVLIRRLVEECALRGVSAIVLDPNNDLARLGDSWPQPPDAWRPEDAARADDYLRNTDVVVWTPRRETGRPLTFRPLPDFAAVADDPDEFRQAIETAVAALAPRARADGATAKAERSRAVLNQALQYFAHRTGGGLSHFLDLLSDLPDGVTPLAKADEMAADMAQTLRAAMINDPLFGGVGEPVDPGVLLTPAAGKRARISVISLIGLPAEEQRQSFVNQLQMALFAWIKRHPAGDRPLGGLLVMDEAQTIAPSGSLTASTYSTLALASQARKYGLGLVFATQAPRGIHNRISGNAATQFFGFLNSPPQIAAAKEMAAAKSSSVPDISRLGAGQFYAVAESLAFQKICTPICLSYHPSSPLTVEEVIARARQS
ncbi:helicase HerA domain-containing protein [Kutzneria sp. NPDC052558]|uniref:helicase HerA domain-containing protein n=1 Tax=Kutzneria sp. NPDC052558 TaxID=3364121 RepID=UPI0037CB78DD